MFYAGIGRANDVRENCTPGKMINLFDNLNGCDRPIQAVPSLSLYLFLLSPFCHLNMFRCASLKLAPSSLLKRQALLIPSKVTSRNLLLKPTTFRHSFSTSRVVREEIKEQASAKTPKADPKEIKRLFRLAKPEAKSLTGKWRVSKSIHGDL